MTDKEQQTAENDQAVAVAISSSEQKDLAPKILASGHGRIAEQILQLAFANGVKVREDADLAQILSSMDIDSEIPVEAFGIVAEILTYLYRINGTFESRPDGTFYDDQRVDPSNWLNNTENSKSSSHDKNK